MSYNFLDKTGLTYFWNKIKTYILKNTAPLVNGTQTASTSAWTGVAPFASLEDGQVINYYLPYASTNTSVTLNLTLANGSTTTGALPVYFQNGTERMTTHFSRGSVIPMIYKTNRVLSDGTAVTNSWFHLADRDTNSMGTIRTDAGGIIAGTNGIKKYSLCALDTDGKYQSFTTTSGTDTTKTINTSAKFLHPMTIYQNSANADYANNTTTGKYQIYNANRVDVRYSCNNYNNFVVNKPLYLECTKDADGFLSVTSNVMVQSGFVGGNYYVYLGEICNDAKYILQLVPQHPTYYYTGQFFVDIVDWKVDKVDGMGLSECNYTTTDRDKLTGIADNATRVIVDSTLSSSSTNAIQNKAVATQFTNIQNGITQYFATKDSPALTGTPTAPTASSGTNTTQIATTAFVQTAVSGKQNALATQTAYTSKGSATKVPKITTNSLGQVTGITEVTITQPTVNNGTLTIQRNGTNVQTFTANQSTNATANISVPTKVSDLTNDSGFTTNTGTVTSVAVKMNNTTKGTITTSGTIDLGTVITAHQDISGKVDKVNGKSLSTNDYTTAEKTLLSGLGTYSSTEVAVGTWLNGQTIYRKVISGTPSAQNSNVQHGVTNFGAPINCYGFYKRNSDSAFEPMPGTYTNWECWMYDFTSTKFTLRFSNNAWNSGIAFYNIVFEYIKSED